MNIGRLLVTTGLLLVVLGGVFLLLQKFGMTRLPGDIHIEGKNVTFSFPIVTCLVVSVVLSLLFNVFFRK